ncbi:unnamed protein product [Sphagnum troendelagicum]|uniref:ARM repeat superfamily protein n=1 Tax=Sphagnum troendelagicum TaxID=128251 RepID=A0ABP0UR52_9BRYO
MPKTVHFSTSQPHQEAAAAATGGEPISGWSPASSGSSYSPMPGAVAVAGAGGDPGSPLQHMKVDIPPLDSATVFNRKSSDASTATTLGYTPRNLDLESPAVESRRLAEEEERQQHESSDRISSNNKDDDEVPEAPEKSITLVVVRLTLLEKAATLIGTLTFVWATVILLGGFSTFLEPKDFWFITIILFTEGTRIFSRSHELEWQHAAAGSSLSIFHPPKWFRQASAAFVQEGVDVAHKSKRVVSDFVMHHQHGRSPLHDDHETISSTTGEKPIVISKRDKRIAEAARTPSVNRMWSKSAVPLVPWLATFSAQTVSLLMTYLQICSALLSVGISLWRLSTLQEFQDTAANVKLSLYTFYSMSCLEASIFLAERSYWYYKITWGKLLKDVKAKVGLQEGEIDENHQQQDRHSEFLVTFFYEVYAKCLRGSVFDGLDMDLVGYSLGLIQSDDAKQVLSGIRVLKALAYHENRPTRNDTFRRIGITSGAIDRLVEMLAWCNPHEKEIRRNAAAVVEKLVHSSHNCSRVAAVVGSLENIVSLLYNDYEGQAPQYCITPSADIVELQTYGLGILKSLASNHALCLKIGETRGLLPILVDNIEVHYRIMRIPADLKNQYHKTIKRSLQLLEMLTGTTGYSGKVLRPAIASVVSTIPHVRDILEYKERFGDFQRFAVEILTNLALDESARETIGSTGGVIKTLMALLAGRNAAEDEEIVVAVKAGEALTRLALKNSKNCERIAKLQFTQDNMDSLDILIDLLQREKVANSAAKILRSIFHYTNRENQRRICVASEFLMAKVVETSDEVQEAALGLVAKSIHILHDDEFEQIWTSKISQIVVVKKLMGILKHIPTTTRSPCRRRYAIELVIGLVKRAKEFQSLFINVGLVQELNRTLLTISDVENFLLFSGGGGLLRHSEEMEDLIEKALHILQPPCDPGDESPC